MKHYTDRACRRHIAELEKKLARPIPERGLRERLLAEYRMILELEV